MNCFLNNYYYKQWYMSIAYFLFYKLYYEVFVAGVIAIAICSKKNTENHFNQKHSNCDPWIYTIILIEIHINTARETREIPDNNILKLKQDGGLTLPLCKSVNEKWYNCKELSIL